MLKPLPYYPAQVRIGCLQHGSTSNIQGKLCQLRETGPCQLVGDGARCVPEVAPEAPLEALKVTSGLGPRGRRKLGPDLKASPRCSVEELTMVGSPYEDDVGGHPVDLQQQC